MGANPSVDATVSWRGRTRAECDSLFERCLEELCGSKEDVLRSTPRDNAPRRGASSDRVAAAVSLSHAQRWVSLSWNQKMYAMIVFIKGLGFSSDNFDWMVDAPSRSKARALLRSHAPSAGRVYCNSIEIALSQFASDAAPTKEEAGYFRSHWPWEQPQVTCAIREYYEVGNVGAPCIRLYRMVVDGRGALLTLELPVR